MKVEIVYAKPNAVFHEEVELSEPATVMHAIARSRLFAAHPEIDWRVNKLGIYGKLVSGDAILKENFSTYEVQHWSVDRKRLHRLEEITSLGMDFGMRECDYCHHDNRTR